MVKKKPPRRVFSLADFATTSIPRKKTVEVIAEREEETCEEAPKLDSLDEMIINFDFSTYRTQHKFRLENKAVPASHVGTVYLPPEDIENIRQVCKKHANVIDPRNLFPSIKKTSLAKLVGLYDELLEFGFSPEEVESGMQRCSPSSDIAVVLGNMLIETDNLPPRFSPKNVDESMKEEEVFVAKIENKKNEEKKEEKKREKKNGSSDSEIDLEFLNESAEESEELEPEEIQDLPTSEPLSVSPRTRLTAVKTLENYIKRNKQLKMCIPNFTAYSQNMDAKFVDHVEIWNRQSRVFCKIRVCDDLFGKPKVFASLDDCVGFQIAYTGFDLISRYDPKRERSLQQFGEQLPPELRLVFRKIEHEAKLNQHSSILDKYRPIFSFSQHLLEKEFKNETKKKLIKTSELKKVKPLDPDLIEDFLCFQNSDRGFEWKKMREQLPAYKCRDEILNQLSEHDILVVDGATGSGKTTQIPQFILEDAIKKQTPCNIIVCEPRRISATSVARRVGDESGLRNYVGHQIHLDSNVTKKTRLTFCTNGILLKKLEHGDSSLDEFSHVILDEVHERSAEIDVLMLLLRDISKRRNLKVILMSATISIERLVDYFEFCGIISIPGRCYHVEPFFFEDRRGIRQILDEIESGVYKAHVEDDERDGVVLVFLPGMEEICRNAREIENDRRFDVIKLHSQLANDDQVFRPPRPGKRKIVLSTNIAETGVTIPQVKYVVDSGRVNTMFVNSRTGTQSLKQVWISQAEMKQRRGRAGRTSRGVGIHLFSETKKLEQFPIPEILRTRLAEICLTLLSLNYQPSALKQCLDDPGQQVSQACSILKSLGCVEEFDNEFRLTSLGERLNSIPVHDVFVARMTLLGACFGLTQEISILASCLGNNFVQNDSSAYSIFRTRVASDHEMLVSIFQLYLTWDKSKQKEEAEKHGLSLRGLRQIGRDQENLKKKVSRFLYETNFTKEDRRFLLHKVAAASCYPSIGYASENWVFFSERETGKIFSKSLARKTSNTEILLGCSQKLQKNQNLTLLHCSYLDSVTYFLLCSTTCRINFLKNRLYLDSFEFNCCPRTGSILLFLRHLFLASVSGTCKQEVSREIVKIVADCLLISRRV